MRFPLSKLFFAVLLTALSCFAQEQEVTFRSDTTLVEFTIIALDSKGNPVRDLKPEEITIREKSGNRSLAFFQFEGGKQEESFPELPQGTFSNRVAAAPGPPRNVTAILLDVLNTEPEDQVFAKAQVMKFLRQLAPDTRVAIYILGKDLVALHDFTDDPASLRERLALAETRLMMQKTDDISAMAIEAENFVMSFPEPLQAAMQASMTAQIELSQMINAQANENRTLKTLNSLEILGQHLSGIPGRKSVVWVSGGIQMLSVTGRMGNGQYGQIKSYENVFRDTGQKLATQGVAMYAVDARGNRGPAVLDGISAAAPQFTAGQRPGQQGMFRDNEQAAQRSNDPLPAMEKLAGMTGGRAIFNTNDMTSGIKAVASDVEGSYSLGFYSNESPDNQWRDLDVRVSRKGVKLRHPKGYLAEAPIETAKPWTEQEWGAVIYNPVGSSALPIDAKGSLSSRTDANEVTVIAQFEAEALHFQDSQDGQRLAFVELALIDKSADGTFRIKVQPMELPADADQPFQFRHTWELMPDAVNVRVILHDQLTGRHGTLDLPLKELPRVTP